MHVSRLAGLKDQADLGARALAHEMMVDRRDAEQARDRRPLLVHTPVAQDQELVTVLDRLGRLLAEVVHGRAQPVRPFRHAEQQAQGLALEVRVGDLADFF